MNIQISDVFKTFATSGSESSVVYSRSRLALKPNTHLIIGTPTSVVQYSAQKILKGVQIMCVDEADVLLTGSESKATWEILETMRTFYKQDTRALLTNTGYPPEHGSASSLECGVGTESEKSSEVLRTGVKFQAPWRQLIFTAATLPSGGPKTVYSLLQKWLPKTAVFISTELTHQTLPTAKTTFVDINYIAMSNESSNESSNETSNESILLRQKLLQLTNDLNQLKEKTSQRASEADLPGVLIFTNTVSNAKAVHDFLSGNSESQLEAAASGTEWWAGRLGQLHKGEEENERSNQDTIWISEWQSDGLITGALTGFGTIK